MNARRDTGLNRVVSHGVIATELFTNYTRLAFGVTMTLAAWCVLLEQIGRAL